MTIGIVARPPIGHGFIVIVSDMRIASGIEIQGKEFATVKFARLAPHWGMTFSAEDIGYVTPIREKITSSLNGIGDRVTSAQVQAAVSDAYQTVRSEIVVQKYLKMYGFDWIDSFRRESKLAFGTKITSALMRDINSFDLKVQLLICGYDENCEIKFTQVSNPGICVDRSDLDAWAIGSGYYMAMASLNSRAAPEASVEAVVYRCCEAKFAAEFAGVGRSTTVLVLYPDDGYSVLTTGEVESIRKIFETSRYRPVPIEAVKEIKSALKSHAEPGLLNPASSASASSC